MKILHTVESYLPARHGMQEVVTRLSEGLVKKGHEVIVAARSNPERKPGEIINGVKVKSFSAQGNMVYGIKGETQEYIDYVTGNEFDIITCFAAQQWATDLLLPLIGTLKAKKVFVPTGFSGFYIKDYEGYFERMKDWMRAFDRNIFLSEDYRDINFAKANHAPGITLIPNGAAAAEFLPASTVDIRERLDIPKHHKLILHVGSYTGIKGHAQALGIFNRAKIKNATLLMVGENEQFIEKLKSEPGQSPFGSWFRKLFTGKKLIIQKLSREETVAAFREADVFLFPSQLECSPIVLFEAMASKTPFLTTDVGNAREIIEWSGHSGWLIPTTFDKEGYGHADIEKAASQLEQLLSDEPARKRMAEAGFKAWEEKFTWEKIIDQYEQLYLELLGQKQS